MGFDLWRLFAGAMLMQTMFNFCSYRNIKEEKNKEEAILILNLCVCFFFFFLTMKTIMGVTDKMYLFLLIFYEIFKILGIRYGAFK